MYGKEEAAKKRKRFWTAFGRYMSRDMSERGPKIKWLNYKTGVKDIYFRCHADKKVARVSIEVQHKDDGLREIFYEQFLELKMLLHSMTETEWLWEDLVYNDSGAPISRISFEMEGVNIYNDQDWAEIFAFFKKHLVPLDEIWANAITVFQDLAD